jgi:hypothetical protein
MHDTLQKLREQAEDEGYEPGTPKYEYRYLELRVERCRELQEVTLCTDCRAFDACQIGKDYARRKVFALPSERP